MKPVKKKEPVGKEPPMWKRKQRPSERERMSDIQAITLKKKTDDFQTIVKEISDQHDLNYENLKTFAFRKYADDYIFTKEVTDEKLIDLLHKDIKKFNFSSILDYSSDIDELLSNPRKFQVTEEEWKVIHSEPSGWKSEKVSDEHLIDLSVNYPKGGVDLLGYFNDGTIYLTEMDVYPEREGYGRNALKFLNKKYGDKFKLFAEGVAPQARGFWEKMYDERLIDDYH